MQSCIKILKFCNSTLSAKDPTFFETLTYRRILFFFFFSIWFIESKIIWNLLYFLNIIDIIFGACLVYCCVFCLFVCKVYFASLGFCCNLCSGHDHLRPLWPFDYVLNIMLFFFICLSELILHTSKFGNGTFTSASLGFRWWRGSHCYSTLEVIVIT